MAPASALLAARIGARAIMHNANGGRSAASLAMTGTTSSRIVPAASSALLGSIGSGSSIRPSTIGNQTTRTMATKTRRRRDRKKKIKARMAELGIERKPPRWHIARETPIVNAISREERARESREYDEKASSAMKSKIETQDKVLRFDFTGLKMSDRVRKLFDLTNGNQKEVVKAQKRRGMELFQLREGDTGSSAVQVIALTTRIQQLQTHMAKHKKDVHSKRGMDALYVRRRKLLDYMERKDFDSYRRVVKTLGLIR
mmetsp:Transcript_34762/g.75384  ORF Transcript_34762/g.75384 Transcript_34762/m.75384 type:complete len:258 (-) Transcript_34762:110-883(-)